MEGSFIYMFTYFPLWSPPEQYKNLSTDINVRQDVRLLQTKNASLSFSLLATAVGVGSVLGHPINNCAQVINFTLELFNHAFPR